MKNQKAGERYGRVRNLIRIMVSVLAVSFFMNTVAVYAHRTMLQQGIAEEVIRFHVLANSDSQEDQEIKLLVRDAVLAYISGALDSGEKQTEKMANVNEIKIANKNRDNYGSELQEEEKVEDRMASEKEKFEQFVAEHLEEITTVANQVLEENGMSYRAAAELQQCYFPDRTYGDCTFPAGWYEALRIRLGEAKGRNWWCVLYPKLCFSDCLHAVVEEEQMQELEEVLTVEEYESLLCQPGKWKIAFRWFR